MSKQRYKKLRNYKGIRQDRENGRYLAAKYINGREYSRKFSSLRDAIQWRANFHPAFARESIVASEEDSLLNKMSLKSPTRLNGEDLGYYFRDVWKLYSDLHLSALEKTTRTNYELKKPFFNPLMNFKMVEITATLLDHFISEHKKIALKMKSTKRFNFNNELKALKSILNWYRINYDSFFVNPILPRHRNAGVIRPTVKKNKKMKPNELLSFFEHLTPYWRDFAETQFYLAARVGEVAGLQAECINFDEQMITVKYVAVWDRRTNKFDYLKDKPKNGEERYVYINQRLDEIMKRRLPLAKNGFVFHADGVPFSYRTIQHHYNIALKRAGLYPGYSSTHIMRHSMGTITRRVTGSLDATQAVTGHKDIKMAQHYASLPTEANRMAVNEVNDFMLDLERKAEKPKAKLRLM